MRPVLGGVVVVGGGPAAANCAASLRMRGYDGSITIVSGSAHLPYTVPALSKAYLKGAASLDDILVRPAATYTDHDISVRRAVWANTIDRSERRVHLSDGTSLPYKHLVLATGGRPRVLPAGVVSGGRVQYLRSVEDADALRSRLTASTELIVVGGGYLGLEVAAVARANGVSVTVIEAMPRLLARVTSPEVSDFFYRLHREEGVDVRLETSVSSISTGGDGRRTEVEVGAAERLTADLVLVSIGLEPMVDLAHAAGLDVRDGIVVDEFCRTSDPAISAAGDCTRHPCFENGGSRRLESLPNAHEQAEVVAADVTGHSVAYRSIPWFWSEQFDVTLQGVGLPRTSDQAVVRGSNASGRSFSVFYLRDGRVHGADVVSNPREFAVAKKLVAQRSKVTIESLKDTALPLKGLITAA